MAKSYSRGHEIISVDNKWYYKDTYEIFDDSRPCKKCKCYPTKDGHDACMGNTPGVNHACCGHGVDNGYKKY